MPVSKVATKEEIIKGEIIRAPEIGMESGDYSPITKSVYWSLLVTVAILGSGTLVVIISEVLIGRGTSSPEKITLAGSVALISAVIELVALLVLVRLLFLTQSQVESLAQAKTVRDRTAYNQIAETLSDKLVISVQRKLLEVSQSEPDWDSYGAQPTSLNAVRKAEELFAKIANQFYLTKGEKIRPYDVAPLTNGGVQMEWRSLSGALEVEVHPSLDFRYLLIQGTGDTRQFKEGDNVSASEIIRLVSGILNEHNTPQSSNTG